MTIARIENGQIIEQRSDIGLPDVPAHKRAQWRVVTGDQPAYDPRVEEIVGPVIEIGADAVIRRWTVTDKRLAELIAAIRDEAQRRIIALMGARDLQHCLIKQLNANMRANELNDKRVSGEVLTQQEETEAATLRSMAAAIKAIREASNALEADPSDIFSDSKWPRGV